jgi:hypothetical protein
MAVMFQRFKTENSRKKIICSEALVTLSNIRQNLHNLRSQICMNTFAMKKNLGTVLEQVAQKWNQLSEEANREVEKNTAILKKSAKTLSESHQDVSKSIRKVYAEACSKNASDCQAIVSAITIASNSHKQLAMEKISCAQELERSQLMCLQYKELFEQEQNKVFELLAEKAALAHK